MHAPSGPVVSAPCQGFVRAPCRVRVSGGVWYPALVVGVRVSAGDGVVNFWVSGTPIRPRQRRIKPAPRLLAIAGGGARRRSRLRATASAAPAGSGRPGGACAGSAERTTLAAPVRSIASIGVSYLRL